MFGYGEVNQYNRSSSTLFSAYKHIENEKFKYHILKKKEDVFYALQTFFKLENKINQSILLKR